MSYRKTTACVTVVEVTKPNTAQKSVIRISKNGGYFVKETKAPEGFYLNNERSNLDIQFSSRSILVIGDLGLWHGRRMGYKEIPSVNIRDCLYRERDMDHSTWYVDKNGDLRCDAIHHDGTNHYLYRTYKDGVSDTQIDNLKEKIYRGIATRADITRVTRRLGDEIAHVYGFPIPRRQFSGASALGGAMRNGSSPTMTARMRPSARYSESMRD